MSLDDLSELAATFSEFSEPSVLDYPVVRRVRGVAAALASTSPQSAANVAGLSLQRLTRAIDAFHAQGLSGLLESEYRERPVQPERLAQGLAQMLLGALAEQHFQSRSSQLTEGRTSVEDHRLSRSDTDFRLLNGDKRPLYRINIKFHGSVFRQAPERVGLAPDDCFPLATYKIHGALEKQNSERLPYIFMVLSVPGLTAASVATGIPVKYLHAMAAVRKRDFEEAIVQKLLEFPTQDIEAARARVAATECRVISARKVYQLLVEKLFERVFALRQKGFTRAYRNAELDMHLSLSREMLGLAEFLAMLNADSPQVMAIRLDRGEI